MGADRARQRVLVTGASGFVGAHFLRAASERYEVLAAARNPPAGDDSGVQWIELDLDRPIEDQSLPAEIDAVLHLAVSRRHREFPDSALEQFRVNLASTAALLDHAARAGAESFVLMSTGSVYGAADGSPMLESDAVSPHAYFAATKAAAELLLEPYSGAMAVCALRLFFPYGPGQEGRLIPDLIDRVSDGRAVQLGGAAGGMTLCPTWVGDVIGVLEAAMTGGWRGIYNLAGSEVLSLRQMAETIGELVGVEPLFERTEGPQVRFEPDLARLASKVEIAAFRSFRDGVRAVLKSMQ